MLSAHRVAVMLLLLASSAAAQWRMQESHIQESLRGVSVVNEQTVWASGTHGTYVVTRDGGKTWKAAQVPGAEALDFRDVEAFGDTVYLLAAGPGAQSRIYKTSDGGAHWQLQFTNHEPKGFFDCMAFWDAQHGIAVGDPVDGKFEIVTTENGGATWEPGDPKKMPAAVPGEGAFAASGTCIAVQGKKNAWFVTGGSAARVFRSSDGGRRWEAANTPLPHRAPSEGIFAVAFREATHGVIAGGDYKEPQAHGDSLAASEDGGRTWSALPLRQQGYFSGVAWVNGGAVFVGSAASGYSADLKSWTWTSGEGFHAVAAEPHAGVVWAVGANGRIALFVPSH